MNEFIISTCSTADLSREHFDKRDIKYVYFHFEIDGKDYPDDLGDSIPFKKFYEMMAQGAMTRTSQVSIGEYVEFFEPFLKEGKDILHLALSSGISGTFNSASVACEQLKEKYPDRKVVIVDSLRYGFAITQMIIKAAEMRDEGKSIEEVAAWLEANRNCYHQMGVMDDLFFLARTGRVTNFKAFFGTLVGVNAMGDYSRAGISEVLGKIKGKKKALDATIEYLKRTVVDPENQIMFIGHTLKPDTAEILRDMVQDAVHPKEIIIGRVDMSCGANIGPGMAVVFYYGKEATEDLAEEKKIIAEASGK